jgi:uncharacterized membrane protein YqjE
MSNLKKKINKLKLELTESKENKKNQLLNGFKLLCLSLIGIISGPVLVQIGIIENGELLNSYSILGVVICVIAIILIFLGIKKIGDYIFIKNDR